MARELMKPVQTPTHSSPTHEQIAERAYQIFIERGRPEGCAQEHWLEAETQLMTAHRKQSRTSSMDKMMPVAQRPNSRS